MLNDEEQQLVEKLKKGLDTPNYKSVVLVAGRQAGKKKLAEEFDSSWQTV